VQSLEPHAQENRRQNHNRGDGEGIEEGNGRERRVLVRFHDQEIRLDVDKREEEEGDTRAARQQRPRPMLTLLQPFLWKRGRGRVAGDPGGVDDCKKKVIQER